MGFVIVIVGALYLLISIGVVALAVSHAKKHGKSAKRWGFGAALAMWLIPFWDWIPTVAVHRYYCATESGFWVYKTLDQWKTENPGVAETLVANMRVPLKRQGDMVNYTDTYFLNQRFNWIVKHNGKLLLNRWQHEQEVVDVKMNEVLARYVDFSTAQQQREAGWTGWKFWLANQHCSDGAINSGRLSTFMESANDLGGKGN